MLKFLFDGAFGTYIYSKNPDYYIPEYANISDKEMVINIHREYIRAGSTAIRTNTFGANSAKIKDIELCDSIIRSGYRLACEAVKNTDVCVFADIGLNDSEDAQDEYVRVADIFIDEGAKNFIFETQNDADVLENAISHIKRKIPEGCVIVSFGIGQDGFNKSGEYFDSLFSKATRFGVDYVGFNCICGPTHLYNLLKKVSVDKCNLIVMPNSGYPTHISGRIVYSLDNPEYFAGKMLDIYSLGVKIIGACCGSTPEHIRYTAQKLDNKAQAINDTPVSASIPKAMSKDDFKDKFIAVEIDPPQNTDVSYVINAAKQAKTAGCNFITIPDSPLGKIRANSFMTAALIQRHANIDVIPHICCRDKNNIAIKGDLIAANIEGISRALVITGDILKEVHKESRSVFGFNSFKLISFIKSLNEMIFTQNPYSVCGALNINAVNFESELSRAQKKIENGVDCLFTQPIFSDKHLENYFCAKEKLSCKIAAGIMPLAGYKNALFLNNEVPGIKIPDEIINQLKNADSEETEQICLSYSKSIVDKIGKNYDGYYIMTQLKKINFSTELVRYIKGSISNDNNRGKT